MNSQTLTAVAVLGVAAFAVVYMMRQQQQQQAPAPVYTPPPAPIAPPPVQRTSTADQVAGVINAGAKLVSAGKTLWGGIKGLF